ncbi:MAG TPA: toll/interleukin-1 receptor domain-containing protein [Flavipsychrobacter sp.]|nr:toll/interleukin-1 receptor domain-containing protein [Flavipsychrobacter sp.]
MPKINNNSFLRILSPLVAIFSLVAAILALVQKNNFENKNTVLTLTIGIISAFLGLLLGYLFLKVYKKRPLSKVFIAHTSDDKEQAEIIIRNLLKHKIKVIDEDEITIIGEDVTERYKLILKDLDYVLLLYSKSSISDIYFNEIAKLSKSKKIIPIVMDEGIQIPQSISKFPSFKNSKNGIDELAKKLVTS